MEKKNERLEQENLTEKYVAQAEERAEKNNKKNDNLTKSTKKSQKNNQNNENLDKKRKNLIIGLSVASSILAVSTLWLGIGLGISQDKEKRYKTELENVYQSNFYNLVDSVNNLENKVAKVISSTNSTYQRKTLLEASKNASEAEISVSYLPFSHSDIQETEKMINQISGYTSTLAEKMVSGEPLNDEEISTLEQVHQNLIQLKAQLNEFARRLNEGYSILDSSANLDYGSNEFSRYISSLKNNDIEYPTMIYDGPFSDSVVNSAVKGLSGDVVSKEKGKEIIERNFKSVAKIEYESETKGRFETYNYRVTNADDEKLYVQVTQKGGHILTVSGAGRDGQQNIDKASAKEIAIEFASQNGVEDAQVVWSDQIANDIYLNIAPKQNGIVLYPDLVKVKVNTASGTIVGYDATAYFTNHIQRKLAKGSLTESTARGKVPSNFEIISSRLVLSPLDYNREVVCMEVEAQKEDGTYYFYFNVEDGEIENVLKVIETDNGNLLM